MHSVETYLKALHEIRVTGGGTVETSYYGPLGNLLNEIGRALKPRVLAVSQVANTGHGSPDFGFYTANQLQRGGGEPLPGAKPARGVVEVKGWKDDSFLTAETGQVSKYWQGYKLVLVTNYRDFVLVGCDEAGRPQKLETFRMGANAAEFVEMMAHPRKAADKIGGSLVEYLSRVMLYESAIADPELLATFLASYAREARHRIEADPAHFALGALKKGLEEALGMQFEGEKGEHFFQATFIQTLFYGVFSSWVLWHRDHIKEPKAHFDWQKTAWTLHVPMIKSLFEQIATPGKLKPLGIDEVLNWTGAALNRVDRAAFFAKFEEEHAVQYFYEPFLKAYDPDLRKDMGVWYTPPEIVKYQVGRVDRVLREELDLPDGLADERVVILDPCCGTGAYLVETLKCIHEKLKEKGGGALTAQKLKTAAMKRVYGFEILPAPFVIAHLQIGLLLRQLGAPLGQETERAGVYLTNALTGWDPLKKPKDELPFPELMEERDAANKVKQEAPILVILGNPPYNGYAGMGMEEERDLVEAYRTTKRAPKPEGQGLNDLYIRFFRMAERRIVEKSGRGVVCYISNYSWLVGLSHTGMRERYMDVFDKIWIDNLHGDRIISEYAPDGKTSETVFAMGQQSIGIKIGTAISLLVASGDKIKRRGAKLFYQDFDEARAAARREDLLKSATENENVSCYQPLSPAITLGLPFKPAEVELGYLGWVKITEILTTSFSGVKTARDEGLVDIDKHRLERRMRMYYDKRMSNEEFSAISKCLMTDTARFDAKKTRDYLTKRGSGTGELIRYYYRPFDLRWLWWEPETKLLDEKRSEYRRTVNPDNPGMVLAQRTRKGFEAPIITSVIASYHVIESMSIVHPFHLPAPDINGSLFGTQEAPSPNLSPTAQSYGKVIGLDAEAIFYHIISVLHSPRYAMANTAALRQDWPRIPLPAAKQALLDSAALGRRVAALLDTEKPVPGITSGKLDPRLKTIGVIRKAGGGEIDPAQGGLDLTAGWGHGGKGGVTMPGRGKIETRQTEDKAQIAAFGADALDIYLNGGAYWANVPKPVWDCTIGGYQVIKKWLSYREKTLLGRGLSLEEAEYVTEMIRRIAALIMMQPELDKNYETVKGDVYFWPMT